MFVSGVGPTADLLPVSKGSCPAFEDNQYYRIAICNRQTENKCRPAFPLSAFGSAPGLQAAGASLGRLANTLALRKTKGSGTAR